MRTRTFIWFVVAAAAIVLIALVVQAHGGGSFASWARKLHGQ